MSTNERRMRLFAHLLNTGNQMGGWRHPQAHAGGLHDIQYFLKMAQAAEAAKFDAVFFADGPGFRRVEGRDAFSRMDVGKLEPITMLAALAMGTTNIGLIATASTSFNEPYNIARKFASLDHISGGRAGWNAVTSTGENEAHNFNFRTLEDHATRYARAVEFIDVVRGLWDSWEDDAFLLDKQSGRYFDPAKLHALGHEGQHYFVHGPLNVGRTPQGHPLLVQAGGSDAGRDLGARTADAIFTVNPPLDVAQAFYADMKRRTAAYGRDPAHLLIMPSIQTVLGATEAEAQEKAAYLDSLIHPDLAMSWLQMSLGGVDLSAHDPDGPLPPIPPTKGGHSLRQGVIDRAARFNLSIRQIATHVAATRLGERFVGTPEQIADTLEFQFRNGAADGFVISAPWLPGALDEFIALVVPILRERGLFRSEYEGKTLRENLGLPRPPNQFVEHPERHVEPEIWLPAKASNGETTV
jgi:FMN-dependent oxidoreductase (nitrilotriacetate monooxygenase family)